MEKTSKEPQLDPAFQLSIPVMSTNTNYQLAQLCTETEDIEKQVDFVTIEPHKPFPVETQRANRLLAVASYLP